MTWTLQFLAGAFLGLVAIWITGVFCILGLYLITWYQLKRGLLKGNLKQRHAELFDLLAGLENPAWAVVILAAAWWPYFWWKTRNEDS